MDGRTRRGETNRRSIVDAALALVAEDQAFPTAQAVAARAGVAKRSVFHHFPDMESLLAEAADVQGARYWNVLRPADRDADVVSRLADAVAQRAKLFEGVGDVRRVAVLYELSSPVLAGRLRDSRAGLRRHLRKALEPEISGLDRPSVEGILAAGSWEAWEVLRRHQGMSVTAARAAVQAMIEPVLDRALTREV